MPLRLVQGALFLLVFVVALVLWAPAALVDTALRQATEGRLSLASAQGTLWRGEGDLLLQHDHRFLPLGHYHWQLSPRFAAAALEMRLEHDGQVAAVLTLQPWQKELKLERVQLALPAQVLPLFLPQLKLYRLGGALQLAGGPFSLRSGHYDGVVQLEWQHASSGLTDLNPLGDYRITVRGEDALLDIALSTLQGKLLLEGGGRLAPEGRGAFSGTARAAAGQEAALSDLLHHIGPETAPGVFGFALGQ